MKKENTVDMVARIAKNGIITEKEINLIMRRLNAGEKIDLSAIWDGEIEVTEEQTAKGLDWLKNLWKTPTGKERSNNPFGYREMDVLEDPRAKIFFRGEYNAGRSVSYFIPIYLVCGGSTSFEYYVTDGQISIIG